ncbi:uncharacterized protein GLRG_03994, partial [Colletotrichum graminicola M1.001]
MTPQSFVVGRRAVDTPYNKREEDLMYGIRSCVRVWTWLSTIRGNESCFLKLSAALVACRQHPCACRSVLQPSAAAGVLQPIRDCSLFVLAIGREKLPLSARKRESSLFLLSFLL